MNLQNIVSEAPRSEALVRVYQAGQLTINAAASRLLDLHDDSKVSFRVGRDGPMGTRRLFIAKKEHSAYAVVRKGRSYRVRSAKLCRAIAEMLQGYGTYRIEAENPVNDFDGEVCYSIFFRKLE